MRLPGRLASSRAVLWTVVGALTLAGLLLRLEYNRATVPDNPIRADARQYVFYGYNLAHHATFSQEPPTGGPGAKPPVPDSFRSPGYPLFLAGVFLAGEDSGFYGRALTAQAVLGSLAIPLTFLLGTAFLPGWAAATAAGAVAVNPHLVSIGSNLLTETLLTVCLLAALLAVTLGAQRRSPLLLAAAGGLLGACYLVNEAMLLLPFFLAAALWWWKRSDRLPFGQATRLVAPLLSAFLLFWGGWTLRNAVSLPPEAQSGGDRALAAVIHGTYIDFTYQKSEFREFPYREDPLYGEMAKSWSNFFRIFRQRVAERPLRYLAWYLIEKPSLLWDWKVHQGPGDIYVYPVVRSLYTEYPAANALREAFRVTHWPVLLVTLAGLIYCGIRAIHVRSRGERCGLPAVVFLALVYFAGIYSVFICWSRYSIPVRPELYLAFFWTLVAARGLFTGKDVPPDEGGAK